MPGRDDLIQQNIARAQANSQAPRPQESDGKSSSSGGLGAPRSFLGGNFDVYSALDRVEFQGALGDASLRGNIAYIRVWKRSGTAQQTSAEVPAQDIEAYYTDTIGRELDERLGQEREKLEENQFVEYTPGESSYAIITGDVTRDDDGNIIGDGTVETTFVPPPDTQKQKALSSQTPTSSVNTSNNTAAVSAPTTSTPSSSKPAVGAVKSANPNGFINTISRIGSSVLGIAAGKPSYSGGANGNSATSTPSGEMMWQFLFNPSELELEVGPEFKNAETWGVSDKGNSGQPLHWSHNKNALLKFNSVLLNGFVFGRKVEALEQGLIELFMARDGDGQHGPHVLEFVWGKRVFGPCVIKNVNIKEKMWDEGEVVNAEVSFTLEQVPEWTINDGFVDVARPGRLGTIGDPTTTGSSATSPAAAAAGANSGNNPPPGGGAGAPSQKPAAAPSSLSTQFCTQATNAYSNFNNLGKKSNEDWLGNNVNFFKSSAQGRIGGLATEYNNLLKANGSVVGAVALDSKCKAGCNEANYYDTDGRTLKLSAYLACVRGCSYQVASKIQGSYLDDKRCLRPQFISPL